MKRVDDVMAAGPLDTVSSAPPAALSRAAGQMPEVAYLILAHTDPLHFGRLCHAIADRADIYVHIDAKADAGPFKSQALPECVHFIEDRVRCSWGAYSLIEATLRMLRAAVASGRPYSHVVMLSGLDYPIRPTASLIDLFRREPEHQFIRYMDVTQHPHFRIFHEHYWFMEELRWLPAGWFENKLRRGFGRMLRKVSRKPRPQGIVPCWGSQFWGLSLACCRDALRFLDERPDFVRWIRSSYVPDEQFFHTIVGSTAWRERSDGFVPEAASLRVDGLSNLHHIPIGLRKVHTLADFDELVRSQKYFVRKVTSAQSRELLDRLDREVLNAVASEDRAAAEAA